MLPLVAATALSSITSGRLMSRYGRYKIFPIFASVMMAIGITLFGHMDATTPILTISGVMVVFGLGMGAGLQVLVTVAQNAVEARDLGVASAATSFFRNIGAAAGTAVFGTVLISRLDYWLPIELPGRHLSAATASSYANPARLARLPIPLRNGITQAFVHSLHSVFLTGVPMLAVAIAVALVLREVPLGSRSAHERRGLR
jgi:MFS family permease